MNKIPEFTSFVKYLTIASLLVLCIVFFSFHVYLHLFYSIANRAMIMFEVFISSSTTSFLPTAEENDLPLKYQLQIPSASL